MGRGDATDSNGDGEVPRGGDDGDIHRYESCPRHVRLIGELQRGLRIVVAEVDGLAHLGVSLIDGLSGLRSGDLDELTSMRGQHIANAMERGSPFLGGQALPGASGACSGLDEAVHCLVRRQRFRSVMHGLHATG